ncbi:MAG: N-acetylmuramoyl-L-alanine amidase [Aestuariivirga sp.]
MHLFIKYLKLSCIYGLLATGLSTAVFAQQASQSLNPNDPVDTLNTYALSPAPPMPLLDPSPKHVVVIDPGHGGIDPGAVSRDGTKEKDVVLAYAKTLKLYLEGSGKYEVLLTRSTDKFIKLDDRVAYAREHKAELFIAVHADMLDNRTVRGTTVYTVSDKASDFEADALAKKENGADKIAGLNLSKQKQDVANALVTLAQRESQSEALLFAQKTVHEVTPFTELSGSPLRSAAFVVLKAPDVPSVLVELGYLSNTADETRLKSAQWRKDMAGAMSKAVDGYFNTASANAER